MLFSTTSSSSHPTYTVFDSIVVVFTPTPTPGSRSSLSDAHKFMFFFHNRNTLPVASPSPSTYSDCDGSIHTGREKKNLFALRLFGICLSQEMLGAVLTAQQKRALVVLLALHSSHALVHNRHTSPTLPGANWRRVSVSCLMRPHQTKRCMPRRSLHPAKNALNPVVR